ncbi:Polypeptide-transport-associated domain-containing protein [Sphingomonas paucimobilis]|nr:Polypeptide-transport-associated domain-containing protein [Sphingomonas paucimobilis]
MTIATHRTATSMAIFFSTALLVPTASGQTQVKNSPLIDIVNTGKSPLSDAQGQDSAWSAAPAIEASAVSQPVFIGAIQIDGRSRTELPAFASVIEANIGREGSAEDLARIAASIAAIARARGFLFASAMIPPQAVTAGLLRVQLDEGQVDEVRIVGSNNRRLRSILQPLEGGVAQRAEVERRLLLAEDLPGVRVTATRFVREQERGVLIVEVRNADTGYLAFDNYGPDANGPIRARLSYEFSDIIGDGDNIGVQIINTVAQPKELAYGSARYSRVIDDGGDLIGVYAALGRSRPGSDLRRFDLQGEIWQVGAYAAVPLRRSNKASFWINGDLNALGVRQWSGDDLIQKDRIVTATISLSASLRTGKGWLQGGAGLVQGLGFAGTTGAHDPLASRFDASATFTKAIAWFNWTQSLTDTFSLRLAGTGQLASRPMLSSQEIAFGGPYYGRGYDFSERTGDSGGLGLIELRRQVNLGNNAPWLQFFAFADGGVVDNLQDGWGGGSLASAGGGMRAGWRMLDFSIEAAAPLSGPRYDAGNKAPKINLAAGIRF